MIADSRELIDYGLNSFVAVRTIHAHNRTIRGSSRCSTIDLTNYYQSHGRDYWSGLRANEKPDTRLLRLLVGRYF